MKPAADSSATLIVVGDELSWRRQVDAKLKKDVLIEAN